jgi:ribosomal protein S18 acetylase RimI-like enzyme
LAAEEAQPRISIVTTPTDESAAGFELPPRPTIIYGAVMASTIPLTSIEDHGLLAADDYTHTHAMYILTLGSRAAVRRRGVASALLAECIEAARRQPQCGAVYLHVKADNISALRFYEKNGFRNVRFLEGEILCGIAAPDDCVANARLCRLLRD